MQEQLHALIANHCTWLANQVATITETLAPLTAGHGPEWRDAVALAREQTHQISGTSGTMGFAAVSLAAEALEAELVTLGETHGHPDTAARDRVAALLRAVLDLTEEIAPEQSSLYGVDLAQIAR